MQRVVNIYSNFTLEALELMEGSFADDELKYTTNTLEYKSKDEQFSQTRDHLSHMKKEKVLHYISSKCGESV